MIAPAFELRDTSAHAWDLLGRPSTYDRAYFVANAIGRPSDTYYEEIAPGAFDTAITGMDDVDLRVMHDTEMRPLASTAAGTLRFTDDREGPLMGATLSKGRIDARAAVERIKSRELRGLSVGMLVRGDTWGTASDGRTALRRIHRAQLAEVSLVTRPMNPHATISELRRENRGSEVEYRYVALRQGDDGDQDDDGDECPRCNGTGMIGGDDPRQCPDCLGTGAAPDDDDQRGDKYSAEELQHMMQLGHALPNAKGKPSYPIGDREDVRRAVRAVGRGSRSPERIRLHIVKNARRLNATDLIPPAWNTSDGSLKRSRLLPNDTEQLMEQLVLARRP
jgi:HK97 family phage prohead protease